MNKLKQLNLITGFLLVIMVYFSGSCNVSSTGESQTTPAITTSPVPAITTTTTKATEPTTSQIPSQTISDVSVTEAYTLIQKNTGNPDFIIIDVRTPEEYAAGHLENALLIDYNSNNFKTELGKLPRDKQYLIYCRTARRSGLALEVFTSLGFTNVLNMTGGITEWTDQRYPVVK
jgi:rhodanese-related sulfurtransferase